MSRVEKASSSSRTISPEGLSGFDQFDLKDDLTPARNLLAKTIGIDAHIDARLHRRRTVRLAVLEQRGS
jgi:hypothetical protein